MDGGHRLSIHLSWCGSILCREVAGQRRVPPGMECHMLDGKRVKQLIYLGIFITIYCMYTFGSPYYAAYSAKPITRNACNRQIQEDRMKLSPLFVSKWEPRFISSLKSVGIFVEPEQYSFVIDHKHEGRRDIYKCIGRVKFALENEWIPAFGYFESPKFRTVHTIDVEVDYVN